MSSEAFPPISPTSASTTPSGDEFNYYRGYIGGGIFFFTLINYLTRYLVPTSANSNAQQRWKWRNVFTSLVHSTITGLWAPLTFYLDPMMCEDMIYTFNHSSHILIAFSVGYFIYDFFDMYLYNQRRSSNELLIHHVCVITCLGIAAYTRHYLPYACLALIVEINSVFLHARQLLIIQGRSRQSVTYRNVALLNMATFVLFRILLLGWMVRWITVNRDQVPTLMFTAGSMGLFIIISMNTVLFYRIINTDFFHTGASSNCNVNNKLACESDMLNKDKGFHPVTKDVKNIMMSLFEDEEVGGEKIKTD